MESSGPEERQGRYLFRAVESKKQAIETPVDLPVDPPEVVAGSIFAEVGKLYRRSTAWRPPRTSGKTRDWMPAEHRETLQLLQKGRRSRKKWQG
jgi:hypothetical protein